MHPLAYPWTFTYFKKVANKSYEENTFTLGTTSTVEDFWRLYVHLRRPVDERPTVCDYHVFREGIRPMWEDEANVNGGKWIVRLKKGLAARYWEDVVRRGRPATAKNMAALQSCNLCVAQRSDGPYALVVSCSQSSAANSVSATRYVAVSYPSAIRRISCPSGIDQRIRAACACRFETRCAQ